MSKEQPPQRFMLKIVYLSRKNAEYVRQRIKEELGITLDLVEEKGS